MLTDLTEFLACPVCGEGLVASGAALACRNRHSFDIARQGYVNLLRSSKKPGTADTPEMARARAAFLSAGYYEPLVAAVRRAAVRAADGAPGCIVDAGAGTGYYLAKVLDSLSDRVGLALDISKASARMAAQAHARLGAAVADSWDRLPVRDEAAAVVLDIFAPRNVGEFRRVLAPNGGLVVVTPTQRHLAELVGVLGLLTVDERKDERLATAMEGAFELEHMDLVDSPLTLSHEAVLALVGMGPSARHSGEELAAKVAALPLDVPTTLSAEVALYRPATRSCG